VTRNQKPNQRIGDFEGYLGRHPSTISY